MRTRTSPELRRAIQSSGESVRALARRYGLNPKTVVRWRQRSSVEDRKSGPKLPQSTVLGAHEEAVAVAIRRLTLLPLDDCYYALRAFQPGLTRASLHRCLRRHGVSRLPPRSAEPAPAGGFDLHILDFGHAAGPMRLLIAVERTSKFLFSRLYQSPTEAALADFLQELVAAGPAPVRTVFVERGGPLAAHAGVLDRVCAELRVAHRFMERGWAPGQLARLEQAMGEAARRRAGEFDLPKLHERLDRFVGHFNRVCRLKSLGGLTPQAYLARAASAQERRVGRRAATAGSGGSGRGGRARDPAGTREAILQAARNLLARSGPQGLSLSEVARLAGVNRGTAYQHFESREQLIAATAEWCSQQLHQALFEGLQPRELAGGSHYDISEVADRLASFAMDNPEMCQVWLFRMLSLRDPGQDKFWNEYCSRAERFHSTPLSQDGIDTEVFSIQQLSGAFLWPVWAHSKTEPGEDLTPFARRYARESLRLSLFGVIRPDHYPELVARMARTEGASEGETAA